MSHHIIIRRKITTQTVLAFLLIIFGMALVMLAVFMPPKGEIHPSVITVFGMTLVAAGVPAVMMCLGALVVVIQTVVFCILSVVYISMAIAE